MDWQLTAVLTMVAAAAGFVLRAAWRTWFGPDKAAGCGSGCGGCQAVEEPRDTKRITLPRV